MLYGTLTGLSLTLRLFRRLQAALSEYAFLHAEDTQREAGVEEPERRLQRLRLNLARAITRQYQYRPLWVVPRTYENDICSSTINQEQTAHPACALFLPRNGLAQKMNSGCRTAS